MNASKRWMQVWMIAGALAFLPALARAEHNHGGAAPAGAQTVQIDVTDSGFALKQSTVKAGQPVKLIVTRKTDRTCINDIVLQEYGINQPLPLNKPVEVTFTPKKAGPIHYTCGMGMAGPAITAQ